jgi:glycosyltransferase involved in cell wall biosynthesis
MTGPGIRYYQLARVLSREFPVTLAMPSGSDLAPSQNHAILPYHNGQDAALEQPIRHARAILVPAVSFTSVPFLAQTSAPLIIDGYDPFVAETFLVMADTAAQQVALTQAYLAGDFFICASERQRDWWLGTLEANGRVNRYTYGEDSSLRRLVDLVPFGLPETPPQHTRQIVKGVWHGICKTDRVLLWGGGLWPWLDPLTAIRAVAKIWEQRRDVRLIFPGTRHPNPGMSKITTHLPAARDLANGLGLLDRAIFFGDWVPYADWQNVLLESDLALTLHGSETLESRLAFRSRVLDYIWAGLPVVATRGDATGELIVQYQVGLMVEPQKVEAVAEAILRLLEESREVWRMRFDRARAALTWERAAQPLCEFCRAPRQAPDKAALGERLGNPFYVDTIRKLRADNVGLQDDRTRWQSLAQAYEQRRVVRLINFVQRWASLFKRTSK